jgi:hypothetical protein
MNSENKISIEFGIPEHGWLLTNLSHKDFDLEIDISDVPIDPMDQLCDALIEINKGISEPRRIIWHLEPYCYYLQLIKLKSGYKAIISESDEFDSPTKITTEILGSFEEIILPLYRALKKFWSTSFKPPHWNELNPKRIEELTKLIKEKKEQNRVDGREP